MMKKKKFTNENIKNIKQYTTEIENKNIFLNPTEDFEKRSV